VANPYTVAPVPLPDQKVTDWEEDALRTYTPWLNRTTNRRSSALTIERVTAATRILALAAEVKRLRSQLSHTTESCPR
jgi:hypothetical protein